MKQAGLGLLIVAVLACGACNRAGQHDASYAAAPAQDAAQPFLLRGNDPERDTKDRIRQAVQGEGSGRRTRRGYRQCGWFGRFGSPEMMDEARHISDQ